MCIRDRRWLAVPTEVAGPIEALAVELSTGHGQVFSALESFLEREPSADLERSAAALGLSVRSLQRELATRGATFLETRTRIRVRLAQGLLLRDLSTKVNVVATDVGFGSTSQFHDAFKRATGMAPSEFRRLGAKRETIGTRPDGSAVAEGLPPLEDADTGAMPVTGAGSVPPKERR